jgi:hypothetical protein
MFPGIFQGVAHVERGLHGVFFLKFVVPESAKSAMSPSPMNLFKCPAFLNTASIICRNNR